MINPNFNNIFLLINMLVDCHMQRCREWGTIGAVGWWQPPGWVSSFSASFMGFQPPTMNSWFCREFMVCSKGSISANFAPIVLKFEHGWSQHLGLAIVQLFPDDPQGWPTYSIVDGAILLHLGCVIVSKKYFLIRRVFLWQEYIGNIWKIWHSPSFSSPCWHWCSWLY